MPNNEKGKHNEHYDGLTGSAGIPVELIGNNPPSDFEDAPNKGFCFSVHFDGPYIVAEYYKAVDNTIKIEGPYQYLTMERFMEAVCYRLGLTGRKSLSKSK